MCASNEWKGHLRYHWFHEEQESRAAEHQNSERDQQHETSHCNVMGLLGSEELPQKVTSASTLRNTKLSAVGNCCWLTLPFRSMPPYCSVPEIPA